MKVLIIDEKMTETYTRINVSRVVVFSENGHDFIKLIYKEKSLNEETLFITDSVQFDITEG